MYQPLHKELHEIRLLSLLPGDQSDDIICHLKTEQLRDGLHYEALSYVWGSEENKQKILVNSLPFWATKNLYEALLRLRKSDRARVLWVDAICINQSDIGEKDHQLMLMRDIYSKTELALLWLGEEPEVPQPAISNAQSDQLQQALDLADAFLESTMGLLKSLNPTAPEDFSQLFTNTASQMPHDDFYIGKTVEIDWTDSVTYNSQCQKLKNDPALHNDSIFHAFCLFQSLAENVCLHNIPYLVFEPENDHTYLTNARRAAHWIMQRPWWERIWTVQECILPPRSVLCYGPVKAPFEMFLNAGFNFLRHRTSCCASVPGVNDMFKFPLDIIIELKRVQEQHRSGQDINLSTLLNTFRMRDASEKRDKVYALLPLVRQSHSTCDSRPTATYAKELSPEAVYIQATVSILRAEKNLNIFCQPSHMQKNELLPSWVTDYANRASPAGTGSHFSQQIAMYNACNNSPVSFEVLANRILKLEGRFVGKIQEISTRMVYNTEASNDDVLREWYNDAKDYRKNNQVSDSWLEHFWRTVCGDCVAVYDHDHTDRSLLEDEFRRMMDRDVDAWNAYCRTHSLHDLIVPDVDESTMSDQKIAERIGSIAHSLRVNTSGRKFFITDRGDMGVGPFYAGLQYPRRDEIFVIPGGRTPFVLKAVGEREVPGVGICAVHEFIGDSYLHGYMDGKGMVDFETSKQTVYLI